MLIVSPESRSACKQISLVFMNTYMAMFMNSLRISLLEFQIGTCLNYVDAKATSLLAIFRSKQGFYKPKWRANFYNPEL